MPDPADFDVLILGEHPAAATLSLLLQTGYQSGKKKPAKTASVLHAARPTGNSFYADRPDLEVIHPDAITVHPDLGGMTDGVPNRPIDGVRLLGPQPQVGATWSAGEPRGYVARTSDVAAFIGGKAVAAGATSRTRPIEILGVDRQGVRFREGATERRATLAIITDPLPEPLLRPFGLRRRSVTHRLLHRAFGNDATIDLPQLVAALDIGEDARALGRLMADPDGKPEATLFVPVQHAAKADALMDRWCDRIVAHGLLRDGRPGKISATDAALAGALAEDMIGDRTLLIGPAGGFSSGFGESVYPGMWSAVFAANAVRTAVQADIPQDALQAFRSAWGAVLGEYLRGPQQNLPFLLPLIYTNQAMTDRLGKAMLLGEALVH